MRVAVFGSVPPPASARGDRLLAEILRLRGEGHDVEVVSLDPVAPAHGYLAAPGIAAALEVGLLARRFDAVVVQIEPGLPVRHRAGRVERTLALLALAAGLRSRADVSLRLERADDLPGGPGGRAAVELWKAGDRVVVGDRAAHDELVGALGALSDRVSLEPSPFDGRAEGGDAHARVDAGDWGGGADTSAAHVQAVARTRAASERQRLAAGGHLGSVGAVRVPEWEWLPAPGAGVPDLGPLNSVAGQDGGGRGRRVGAALALRRGASRLLRAAESRPLTRPAARLARLSAAQLRGTLGR